MTTDFKVQSPSSEVPHVHASVFSNRLIVITKLSCPDEPCLQVPTYKHTVT